MAALKIAAIEFLNAAPLMWGLDHDPRFALDYTTPSACADALRDGSADLGVIPAIELARIPGLVGLDGLGVAVHHRPGAEVRSILLISRCPPAEAKSVALDPASRTSAALAQILLRHHWGAGFVVAPSGGDWRASLATADAVLVIGDPALKLRISGEPEAGGFEVRDLAQVWRAWTNLPFVFALWGVRQAAYQAHRDWLSHCLAAALAAGLEHRDALASIWAPRLGLPESEIRTYLDVNVAYRLGPAHRAGLLHFLQLAAADGLIPTPEMPQLLQAHTA